MGALCGRLMGESGEGGGGGGGEKEGRERLKENNAMKNALGAVQKLSLR